MSDGLFSPAALGTGRSAGYRLHNLEVLNWGTFDGRVWRLTTAGQTSLLTGDIGSGKSTLVDALTTLLLPANKISYNKAAGAEAKERTLRSYVEGHYKSERIEASGTMRPIGLRDHRSYSVVLGVFTNEGFDETVSLAQVFHQKDKAGQPDRFFVTSTKMLSIEADFTNFGDDLKDLRRRLRASGAELHDVFPDYSRQVRRLLGIRSEQAMELFHQTVSMKSVGNLNEFVRQHMLEPVDASAKVQGIVAHFEDLTKSHEAVRRARDQLAALAPLVATSERYDDVYARRADDERQRDAVRLYFAELRSKLLEAEIQATSAERDTQSNEAARAEIDRAAAAAVREELVAERASAGGDRVAALERKASTDRDVAKRRRERRARFDDRLAAAQIEPVPDVVGFARLPALVQSHMQELTGELATVAGRITELAVRHAELNRLGTGTLAELDSHKDRTSNVPTSQLDVRTQLCQDLGLDEAELPFAGELLDVAEVHTEWRGAAERVLRGFALSLLVPPEHYDGVARWVDGRRLTHRRHDGTRAGSRLVYERVTARRVPLRHQTDGGGLLLVDCMQIKEGRFADYLRDELLRRADHRCVDSVKQFATEQRAVTRQGQVKAGDRHEKDDRSRVDDPRNWTLGWVNERKVAALTVELASQQRDLNAVAKELKEVQDRQETLQDWKRALAQLSEYTSWEELDWQEAETQAALADAERERLVAGSSALRELERRLAENAQQTTDLDDRLKHLTLEIGNLNGTIRRAIAERDEVRRVISSHTEQALSVARASYPDLEARLKDRLPRTASACAPASDGLTDELQAGIDKASRELGGYTQSLLQYMNDVRRRWPEATTEMDASVEARDDFRAFHDRVATDDLPRFEAEFKRQLNTNAIRELAAFTNWLSRQSQEIGSRVGKINDALGAIDYSPGRYITLLAERTPNREVQDFRSELRAVTDDALIPDDDQYSEQRFADVQRIIERFRGRDGHSEADKAWTRRVTDVRNWFIFSASERDRATDAEWEHYRDSDGKSGGQKEKLAYTILAASLAYQFGLEWGVERSRDFRFAVIDEAFGRGSDASTRYALELFAKLGLQLLIVTPLQKVHVIEPYVQAIGFVDNPDGKTSRLQTLTIEEYQHRRLGLSG